MSEISVITCTHNPRPDYLGETLEALAQQSLSLDQWEYLLIDNASSPEKTPKVDLSWHSQARMIREENLGLTPARLRGIRETRGDLLVFVDDDNVIDRNFLEEALRVAKEKPFLGSWSGQCRPRFDEPPPEWTRRYWGNLVIREFDTDMWSNMPRLPQTMPCGAGLCIRRAVAQRYLALHESGDRKRFQFDRIADSLVSGGDNDLAACACDLGMGVGLISALKLTHLIPPERVTLGYLVKLAEGIYFSAVILDALYARDGKIDRNRVTWRDRLRCALLRTPHREIFAASLRGREKGLAWLASRCG
jgi:glycosyltransferase involved in cell wall biosynthesis